MKDTATHYPVSSRDEYGKPVYGTGVSYKGRYLKKNRKVRTPAGDEVIATAEFSFLGAPVVSPDDKISLSDGKTPTIASVDMWQDPSGSFFYTKVYFL